MQLKSDTRAYGGVKHTLSSEREDEYQGFEAWILHGLHGEHARYSLIIHGLPQLEHGSTARDTHLPLGSAREATIHID